MDMPKAQGYNVTRRVQEEGDTVFCALRKDIYEKKETRNFQSGSRKHCRGNEHSQGYNVTRRVQEEGDTVFCALRKDIYEKKETRNFQSGSRKHCRGNEH